MGFCSHQHLRRNRDFQTVRQEGCRINCGVFVFQVYVRTGEEAEILGPRLGVITSRKVGHAVLRNRLRRQMREIFRRHQNRLASAVDLVLVMRSNASNMSSGELEARYLKVIEKSGAVTESPRKGEHVE